MNNRYLIPAFFRRFLILLAVSIVLIGALSEGAYRMMKDPASRPPQRVEIVIPSGTAERIAAGEQRPTIPEDMIFVAGDVLVVKNEDAISHELNALYIPPQTSATFALDQPNELIFSCSFEPSRYLNLSVRQATTWATRLIALWYGVPVTVMLLLAYSFIFWPLKPPAPAH